MPDLFDDECLYFRINELENGKIQFTDTTNAERLVREHGEKIRYMPAWKKWLVWNGNFWEIDEGDAMVSGFALESIRNIHREMLKTSDHRERIEI